MNKSRGFGDTVEKFTYEDVLCHLGQTMNFLWCEMLRPDFDPSHAWAYKEVCRVLHLELIEIGSTRMVGSVQKGSDSKSPQGRSPRFAGYGLQIGGGRTRIRTRVSSLEG